MQAIVDPPRPDWEQDRRWETLAYITNRLYGAGATRVWLFGSLARGEARDTRSDFDIATDGIEEETLAGLRSELQAQLRCKIDLVGMSDAIPELRNGILACRVYLAREACQAAVLARLLPQARRDDVPRSLTMMREEALLAAIAQAAPRSVLDFGCGAGEVLERLAGVPGIERLTGIDISSEELASARRRLARALGHRPQLQVALHCASCSNPDPRFLGHDAVVAAELIEHLDEPRLAAFGRTLFGFVRSALILITTPNSEFNARWEQTRLRHPDHQFEWSRAEFREWIAAQDCEREYEAQFLDVGTREPGIGAATQMALLRRRL